VSPTRPGVQQRAPRSEVAKRAVDGVTRASQDLWTLLCVHEDVCAAVLGPACLVALPADRPLFSVAGRRDPSRVNVLRHEIVLGACRAVPAEGNVVVARAALVGVALDQEESVRGPSTHTAWASRILAAAAASRAEGRGSSVPRGDVAVPLCPDGARVSRVGDGCVAPCPAACRLPSNDGLIAAPGLMAASGAVTGRFVRADSDGTTRKRADGRSATKAGAPRVSSPAPLGDVPRSVLGGSPIPGRSGKACARSAAPISAQL
jgi:hypothetical protein